MPFRQHVPERHHFSLCCGHISVCESHSLQPVRSGIRVWRRCGHTLFCRPLPRRAGAGCLQTMRHWPCQQHLCTKFIMPRHSPWILCEWHQCHHLHKLLPMSARRLLRGRSQHTVSPRQVPAPCPANRVRHVPRGLVHDHLRCLHQLHRCSSGLLHPRRLQRVRH